MVRKVGVLHPGEMGVSICQALADSGHDVLWVSEGRSADTQARAASFTPVASLAEMTAEAECIFSICPPHAALEQAKAVAAENFSGIYVDANAVSPQTAESVANVIGSRYVDGGVIGPPATQEGSTRLYVSGDLSDDVVSLFGDCLLQVISIGEGPTRASTLKMAYAAYTKGSSALLLAVNAVAEAGGVREELQREWDVSQKGLRQRSGGAAVGTSRKAWRFVGEMEEIAATFESFGLPSDFHAGAAEIYSRMSALKDLPPSQLEEVIARLLEPLTD